MPLLFSCNINHLSEPAFPGVRGPSHRSYIAPRRLSWLAATLACLAYSSVSDASPPVSGDLNGTYLTVSPIGSGIYTEGHWDSLFGGQVSVLFVRENQPLAALGLHVSLAQFTARDGGRLWVDAAAGTRQALGILSGIALGTVVELDATNVPRWGGQLTLWVHAGVVPFVRVGHVQRAGRFVELGLEIPLPLRRW